MRALVVMASLSVSGRPYVTLEGMDELPATLMCRTCNLEKPDTEFSARKDAARNRRGRDYKCRDCKADYARSNKHVQRNANIKRRYGISPDEYDRLVSAGCSTCGATDRRIVLDHCHATGRIRGPLCDRCNGILGRSQDDPGLLRRLAAHLEHEDEPGH